MGSQKKTPPLSFPSCMLKSVWVESTLPYSLLFHHEEAKRDTIGVVGGPNAKLSHCMNPTLIYPMENKMPHLHHTVEWWGCGYTDEDNKGLSERS